MNAREKARERERKRARQGSWFEEEDVNKKNNRKDVVPHPPLL